MSRQKWRCEAVIFDMDGVLIDSEPIWRDTMVECFAKVGLNLRVEDCEATCGLRIDQVIELHFQNKRWDEARTYSRSQLVDMIIDKMVENARTRPRALPGIRHALDFFKRQKGDMKFAVASSSHLRLIDSSLEGLKIADTFPVRCSAEHEPFGKPHPAVYLAAAKKLCVDPRNCLAIEDSLRGVVSAKAAEMRCLAVPEVWPPSPKFAVADAVIKSLVEIDDKLWAALTADGPVAAPTPPSSKL
eukprot:gb/GEZN01013320.1/.p1 GENE.gb/GEZN01013320.1/~~gb/GEZN01013320.1/.p1  ORF type:complete len:244 (+),score=29.10 gb/GEZN01013320.1/:80-811(+)